MAGGGIAVHTYMQTVKHDKVAHVEVICCCHIPCALSMCGLGHATVKVHRLVVTRTYSMV